MEKLTAAPQTGFAEGGAPSAAPPAADGLPLELAFLLSHGVAPAQLRNAARKASDWNVSADGAVLGLGYIDEAGYYRALAAELGLAFLSGLLPVAEDARYPDSIVAGIVPLAAGAAGPKFAIAPRGAMVRRLLASRSAWAGAGVAVTTPTRLRADVMRRRRHLVANGAANDLPDRQPLLSCRDGLSGAQTALAAILAGIATFALTLWPGAALSVVLAFVALVFLAIVVLRLAACLDPVAPEPSRLLARTIGDDELPVYTIIVPVYREVRVVRRLVAALTALNYPAAKLDIKLVLEEDDADTRHALTALDVPAHLELIVAPAGMPRTKPRALNVALPLARGELLAIYDAEDVPDPMQLRLAAATFATATDDIACLQARLVIDNGADGWLPLFFSLEYAALFDVLLPALSRHRLPIPLGGNSNHFRTAILRDLGGWDAWNVTEDADLGIRLARGGWRVADLPSPTFEEAPARLSAWMGQRTRWMKGWMQVCLTHSRQPLRTWRELGAFGSLGGIAMTFGTVMSALGFPIFTILSALALHDGSLLAPETTAQAVATAVALTLFFAGFAAMLLPPLVGARRRGLKRFAAYVPLMPFYYLLISCAAWRALYELARAPFHWHKTEHGLARSSRSGALTDSAGVPLPPRPGRA